MAGDDHLWKHKVDEDCFWWISTSDWEKLEKRFSFPPPPPSSLKDNKRRINLDNIFSFFFFFDLFVHFRAEEDKGAWKRFYAERYRLKQNWSKGHYSVRTFEGHTQNITCVQFDDSRIVSGSADRTIK